MNLADVCHSFVLMFANMIIIISKQRLYECGEELKMVTQVQEERPAVTRMQPFTRHRHVASAEVSSLSGMEQQPEGNTLKKKWRVLSLLFLLCVVNGAAAVPTRTLRRCRGFIPLSQALKAAHLSPSVLINTAKPWDPSHQQPVPSASVI